MTVELASAYVSIVPTTKGIQAGLEKELSPLQGVAAKAGTDSGKALGSSFSGASGGLKSSLGEAEGAVASFKGKAVGAFESVGISAGVLKVAGAAGIVEFGLHSVEAFEHTALAARNLGTATGLSVEDASRWIGVAKDMGVNADTLTSSLGKVGKTLDDTKWADFGIATHDAGGQAKDVNDILLDTFDKLGKVTNETERTREGNVLFGKGYAALSPLIGKTREEMEGYLGAVEKGQVITEGELSKAEAMHQAQAALKQAFGEVTLALGGLLASLAPVVKLLAQGVGIIGNVVGAFTGLVFGVDEGTDSFKKFFTEVGKQATIKQVGDELNKMNDAADKSAGFFDRLVGFGSRFDSVNETVKKMGKESPESVDSVVNSLKDLKAAADDGDPAAQKLVKDYELTDDHLKQLAGYSVPATTDALQNLNAETKNSQTTAEGYSYAVQDVQQSVENEAKAVDENKRANQSLVDDVTRGLDEIKSGWDRLTGDISNDKTWTNLQSDFIDLKSKFEDANKAMKDGTDDATAKALDYRSAVDDQKLSVIDYGKTVLGLPESRLTNVLALIDQGSLDAAQAALNNLTRNYTVNMNIVGHGGAGYSGDKQFASGGYTPGGWVMTGENGRELVQLPKGSYVHTASDTRALMSGWSSSMKMTAGRDLPPINVYNNGREFGINDMNHVLAMARLRS